MKRNSTAQRVAFLGVLAALTVALSVLESLLPAPPIPGARWGLANLTVMAALSFSFPDALVITAVKIGFSLFRGVTACLFSAAGSIPALLVMLCIRKADTRHRTGFLTWGLCGALFHNLGQGAAALCLFGTAIWYYIPLLILAALPAGAVTGLTVNIVWFPIHKLYSGQ